MKKLIFCFLLLAGCSKFSTIYLEEKSFVKKGEEDKMNSQYFSETVENPETMLNLDQNFRKNTINSKDRQNFLKYSKVFFDANLKPVRIENYVQDAYNTHIYYPYLILSSNDESEKILISMNHQGLVNGKVTPGTKEIKVFNKKADADFKAMVALYKKDPTSLEFINQQFRVIFVPSKSEHNRSVKDTLVASTNDAGRGDNFVTMDGYVKEFPEVKINLYFFETTRGTTVDWMLGDEYPIIANLSKLNKDEISFIYINADEEKLAELGKKVKSKETKDMENMTESIYSSKKEK